MSCCYKSISKQINVHHYCCFKLDFEHLHIEVRPPTGRPASALVSSEIWAAAFSPSPSPPDLPTQGDPLPCDSVIGCCQCGVGFSAGSFLFFQVIPGCFFQGPPFLCKLPPVLVQLLQDPGLDNLLPDLTSQLEQWAPLTVDTLLQDS